MILTELYNKKLIHPPDWLPDCCQRLVMSGSQAYACATDTSDFDIRGFCIPPIEYIFPHLAGEIPGFSVPQYRFDQFESKNKIEYNKKEYDFQVYNIVKYFKLAMDCSPEILDTLFVSERCIVHQTKIGEMVYENRHLFLTKKLYHTLLGYSHAQMHKIKIKNPKPGSKRAEDIEKYGVDLKYMYHVVRLVLQCEQALTLGTMDLERDRELYKAIRRGEWDVERTEKFLLEKENALQNIYDINDTLPHKPDEAKIKQLLLNCLEEYYGSLRCMSEAIIVPDETNNLIGEIKEVLGRYERR